MLISTVFLGLLTGLAFYPAVVVWVGRFIPHKSGVEASAPALGRWRQRLRKSQHRLRDGVRFYLSYLI
jgi:hypothetical protein